MKKLLSIIAFLSMVLWAIGQNITFDQYNIKPVETKIGACIYETDIEQFPFLAYESVDLGFQTFFYVPQVPPQINYTHAAALDSLLAITNAGVAIIYPIRSNQIHSNFPEYFDFIATHSPEFIQLDMESLDPLTNELYIERCQEVMAYAPHREYSWDCGLVYKTAPTTTTRNSAIAAEPVPPVMGRQYHQISPDRIQFTTDPLDNVAKLDSYFNVLLPQQLEDFGTLLPNLTKMNIAQWSNADWTTQQLNAAVENYAIGKMAEFSLQNTNKYAYLFFMELRNIVKQGGTKPIFESMKRIIPCYKYAYVVPAVIDIPGCTATGFADGNNNFALLIINKTSTAHTILPQSITIPGKTIVGSFERNTGWAGTWAGLLRNEIVTESDILIRKNSVSLVTFTVN